MIEINDRTDVANLLMDRLTDLTSNIGDDRIDDMVIRDVIDKYVNKGNDLIDLGPDGEYLIRCWSNHDSSMVLLEIDRFDIIMTIKHRWLRVVGDHLLDVKDEIDDVWDYADWSIIDFDKDNN